MGLAASQARLLFITSRQNDVSAKMQRISNETMILARDEDEVLQEYNRLLEGGSTTTTSYKLKDDAILNYNDMMGKGAVSTGAPYIITTSSTNGKGKVVLSTSVASSLGLDPSKTTLAANNIDSAAALAKAAKADANVIKILDKTPEKTPTTEVNISVNNFLNWLDAGNSNNDKNRKFYEGNASGLFSAEFNNLCSGAKNVNIQKDNTSNAGIWGFYAADNQTGYYNGDWQNARLVRIEKSSRSLKELYNLANSQKGMMMLGCGSTNNASCVSGAFKTLTGCIGNQILGELEKFAKGALDMTKVKNSVAGVVDTVYNNYMNGCKQANQVTTEDYGSNSMLANHYYGSSGGAAVLDDADQKHNEGAIAIAMTMGQEQHCIVCAHCYDEDIKNWQFVVNAGNVVKDILEQTIQKLTDNGIYEDQSTRLGTQGKIDRNKTAAISSTYYKADDSKEELPSDSDEAAANYYNNMYSALKNGYLIDDSIENSTTLKEKLTNNTYYVNKKPATSNSDIFEVETETKTSKDKADSYWNTEMTKIKRKEDKMNKDLQKLQTEYTSLTTDYESVKSIITANIGKSYTYCQNG